MYPASGKCLSCNQVVVATDASLEECKRIDEICHSHQPPIAFIRVETRGVFASVFCDFGPSFTVYDVDGEQRLWLAAALAAAAAA
jgi:ubiquitin-activating enzyme E1